ncbi:MAG: hypothetical protein J5501_05110, partial [Ruminococcus sp.]|nr:hypothetical protein [Ruminococcus sp.]
MKKLLSAVTSFVMSTSLITSAFASSFNVSAAGRISAEQPNVSMEDVMDVSALLTASSYNAGTAVNDFVVDSGSASGKPGDKVTINVKVDSGSYTVAQIVARLIDEDLPSGFKVVGIGDGVSEAANDAPATKQGEFYYFNTLKNGEPIKLDDSKAVMQFEVQIPSSATPGDYSFSLSRFTVAPDRTGIIEAKINPGKITVTGNGQTQETQAPQTQAPQTQAPQTQAPQTQNNQSGGGATWDKGAAKDDFVVYTGDWTAKPGETKTINIMVESGGMDIAQIVTRLNDRDLPSGFSVTGIGDGISEACGDRAPEKQGEFYYINNLATDGSAQKIDDSSYVIQYDIKVPSTASGKYEFSLSRFTVASDGKTVYEAKIIPGSITVDGGSQPVTTEKVTSAQQTNAPNTQAQQTNAQTPAAEWDKGPAKDDFIVYTGDWTAKPGETKTINIMVESNGLAVAQLVSRLNDRDLPGGFSVTGIG